MENVRGLVFAVLLVHGLGHGGAIGALAWIAARPSDPSGGWLPARSWLLPSLSSNIATALAGGFWVVSLIGFVVAALAFWGLVMPGEGWRAIAVASAIVSVSGLALFFGTWPVFNTVAALTVNLAVLVGIAVLRWPPQAAVGQ